MELQRGGAAPRCPGRGRDLNLALRRRLRRLRRARARLLVAGRPGGRGAALAPHRSASRRGRPSPLRDLRPRRLGERGGGRGPAAPAGVDAAYLPNGCDAAFYARRRLCCRPPPRCDLPGPIAGFVGHINGRTDLALLEAIATAGASLLLIGPRDPAFEPARFEALAARPNVSYLGPQPFDELLPYLKKIDVGIVPYANTRFNRNSYPMKTLEYLAAGRPVVSTPLPAVRSLETDLVALAETPEDFAAAVLREAPAGPCSRAGRPAQRLRRQTQLGGTGRAARRPARPGRERERERSDGRARLSARPATTDAPGSRGAWRPGTHPGWCGAC